MDRGYKYQRYKAYVSQAVNPPQPRIVYMDPSKPYPETDGTGRPK
jgi:hypothetical protein